MTTGNEPDQGYSTEELIAANRSSWDERVPIHLASWSYDVDRWVSEGMPLRRNEVEALGDVSGIRLLHLQCHVGLDTLAWARAGAHVTGLDFSPASIAAAREIAERVELADSASFVCADMYDAAEALDHATFDIVYVSLGALCWLPSVDRWAEQVGALVAPGGRFYIHDGHPLASALADDRPIVVGTYFEQDEPFVDDSGYTYIENSPQMANKRTAMWSHGMGEIVTALISHGLCLEWLVEHDWTTWPALSWLEQDAEGRWTTPDGMPKMPLSFSLLASRPLASKLP